MLEGLHAQSDLRVPQDLQGGGGSSGKEEGHLGHFAKPAVTQAWKSCRKWMNRNTS